MYKTLKDKGKAVSDHYAGSRDYFHLSPAGATLIETLEPMLVSYCKGTVLDAGAGRGGYRELLTKYAASYVGMDIAPSRATAALGDAQRLPFADEVFDTVFCSQVLEHVPEPWLALAEFRRVLKPNGCLLLTVPHISWLHNEPHDYYRYTVYGLRFLIGRAGLKEEIVVPAGGLFSLLGHIFSMFWINVTFGMPLIHPLVKDINKIWVRLMAFIDRHFEKRKIFALNYVCVIRK